MTLEEESEFEDFFHVAKEAGVSFAIRIRSSDLFFEMGTESRFGIPLERARLLLRKYPSIRAIHVHHYRSGFNDGMFSQLQSSLVKLCDEFPQIERFNIGGGWNIHSPNLVAELSSCNLPLVLEPGRSVSEPFGAAFARITSVKDFDGGTLVEGRLSIQSSLRWARPSAVSIFPKSNLGTELRDRVLYAGPSCYEGDVLSISSGQKLRASVGDLLVFSGIAGYSVAWNHSFNGIEAPVFYLGDQ